MHDDEVDVPEELVRSLLAGQFPSLADLPLRLVEPWGTDNAIWRLGDDLVLRLPRVAWAAEQVHWEAEFLPRLDGTLPVATPVPVALGVPAAGYPFAWAVHRWLEGRAASREGMADLACFALDLAAAVRGLQVLPVTAPRRARNRARPLAAYHDDALQAIAGAAQLVDAAAARRVWEEALAAPAYAGPACWVHGDLEGNCLLHAGALSGIVDWGSACIGDPAVDVQVVWSPLFTEESRGVFLEALGVDAATLARSRGAAVEQACAALPYYLDTYPEIVSRSLHKLAALGIPTSLP